MKKHNPQAELIALVTALDTPNERIRAHILGGTKDPYYSFPHCSEIYKYLIQILNSGRDLPSSLILSKDPGLSNHAQVLLGGGTTKPVATETDALALVETLRKYHNGRLLLNTLQSSTKSLEGDDVDFDNVVLNFEQAITEIRSTGQQEQLCHFGKGNSSDDLVREILEPARQDAFVRLGFSGFDDQAGGLAKKNFMIVASHFKGGKSIFLLNTGINMYENGYSVCIITLEMDKREYTERLLSNISQIPYKKIRLKKTTPEEKQRINGSHKAFIEHGKTHGCRFSIWAANADTLSPPEIGLLLKPYGFDCVIIDYLGLLHHHDPKKAQWERLGDLGMQCKVLTGTLGCPVIAAAQMSMEGDIRYAKALKEHADYVLNWFYKESEISTGIINVGQLATRHTEQFEFPLRARFEVMTISDHIALSEPSMGASAPGVEDSYLDELEHMEGL